MPLNERDFERVSFQPESQRYSFSPVQLRVQLSLRPTHIATSNLAPEGRIRRDERITNR
jgi:hypothetical protein